MNLEARKISFVQEFLGLQNEEVIKRLETLLRKSQKHSSQDVFVPMSLAEYESVIDLALEDSDSDKGKTTKELQQKIKQWR